MSCPKHVETYYKLNIYLLAASSWCSYLSLCDTRNHKTEIYKGISHSLRGAHTSQVSIEVSLNWLLRCLYSACDDGFDVSLKHGM